MPKEKVYSDEDLREAIYEAFHATEGILTRDKYQNYREGKEDFPDQATFSYRLWGQQTDAWLKVKKHYGIREKEIERLFKTWEDRLSGRYGRFTTHELKDILPGYGPTRTLTIDEFVEWNKDQENNLKVRGLKQNSNRGCSAIFVQPEDMDYWEVVMEKHGDLVEPEYEHIFKEFVGKGNSPKSVAAALYYLTNKDVTQREAMEKMDVSEVTVRNNKNKILEEGYFGGEDNAKA